MTIAEQIEGYKAALSYAACELKAAMEREIAAGKIILELTAENRAVHAELAKERRRRT